MGREGRRRPDVPAVDLEAQGREEVADVANTAARPLGKRGRLFRLALRREGNEVAEELLELPLRSGNRLDDIRHYDAASTSGAGAPTLGASRRRLCPSAPNTCTRHGSNRRETFSPACSGASGAVRTWTVPPPASTVRKRSEPTGARKSTRPGMPPSCPGAPIRRCSGRSPSLTSPAASPSSRSGETCTSAS